MLHIFAMNFCTAFYFSWNFYFPLIFLVDIRNISLLHYAPLKSQATDSTVSCISICSRPGPQFLGSFCGVTAPTFIVASLVPSLLF